MKQKIRVALLFGGRSGEHPISIVTAAGVLGAMDPEKYDVVPIGITKSGQWVVGSADLSAAALTGATLPEVEATPGSGVLLSGASLQVLQPGSVPEQLGEVDVVFPVLHGPYGEDGTIQGLLELADVPYVGCGVLASAVGMDKEFMKLVFAGRGLPVGPYVVVRPRQWEQSRDDVLAQVADLALPLFVKPARGGSSLGVTRVDDLTDLADLEAAVAEAQKHDPKVIIEAGLEGREIECAVLGGRDGAAPRASVPGEIVVDAAEGADFYDFEAKYVSGTQARAEAPADLPADVAEKVRQTAIAAFEAVDAEGLSRVDVFVSPAGDVVINEINTLPGFTPISMYPKMWEATGLSYSDLIDELIQLALERPRGLR
ncbi:D-alanine--D-alanine ligase family protein [Nocardioides sp.]|uniref:D-alanine--D-alanine ligase family protein n=1 Tax=Nocardioides sp. TaxID=35761 RepID=UPI002612F197|nr:D-alanine--D-alanine ligase family protein [Nocardioides sp.]